MAKILLPFLMGTMLGNISLNAQEIRQNELGERIVVYPDGSWRFFHKRQLSGGNYPVVNREVTPSQQSTGITREEETQLVNRRLQQARDAIHHADQRALAMEDQEKEIMAQLGEGKITGEALRRLESQLLHTRQLAMISRAAIREAESDIRLTSDLRMKGDILKLFRPAVTLNTERLRESASLSSQEDLSLYFFSHQKPESFYGDISDSPPPVSVCRYSYEGLDVKGEEWRRDGKKELLFTHTDERLRIFFPDKEYLRCEAFLSAVGKREKQLTLEFRFGYPNAREAYGVIERNSLLSLRLLDGQVLQLKAGLFDLGKYDTESEQLIYRMIYPLETNQLQILRRVELEEIRMYWSAGFEVYPVFNVDFFSRQLRCLE